MGLPADDLGLDAADLRSVVASFKAVVAEQSGREFPQDPREQLDLTVRAVFASWNAPRAASSPVSRPRVTPSTELPPRVEEHLGELRRRPVEQRCRTSLQVSVEER
jgi:hypothetical protein